MNDSYVYNVKLPDGNYYSGPSSGIPTVSTPTPVVQTPQIPVQGASQTTWDLSPWTTTGTGNWKSQPVLTINGIQNRYNTPQEYITQLNQLLNKGATGPLGSFINEFQGILPEFNKSLQSSVLPPTINPTLPTQVLKPGDTGSSVKQLQDYLVSRGLMTQPQVDTGYGIYGPQTTAAVAKLQQLYGIDNSSGVGYFGPKTIQGVTQGTALGGVTAAFTPTNAAQAAALQGVNNAFAPIPATNLQTSQTPVNIPPAPVDTTNYSGLVAGGNALISGTTPTTTQPTDFASLLKDYLGSSTPPPSVASTYAQDYASSGIEQKQTDVANAQNELNTVNAQLGSLKAEAEAAKLQQENTFGTTGFTVGQQAQIDRNLAVKALPLQAQALIAQAKLTNNTNLLNIAQNKLDTTFKLHSEDATNQYNYQKDIRDKVFQYATDAQKTQLAAQQKAADQAFTTQQNNLKNAQEIARAARESGQGALAAQIASLDPKSSTYQADVARLAGQIKPKATVVDTNKPLTPTEIQQYQMDYPDAGIKIGDTQLTAQSKISPPVTQKGNMTSAQYVEKVLTSKKLAYNDVISQIPQGKIGVIQNSTGQIGSVLPNEFDPAIYTHL